MLLKDVIFVKVDKGMLKSLVSTVKMGPTILFPIPLRPDMMTMFKKPKVIPKGIEFAKNDLSFGESILSR